MKRCSLPLLALLLVDCAARAGDIPLSKVLARPRDFDGKRIAVSGYYVAATETSCLCTTRDAAKRLDTARSAWVEFRDPPPSFVYTDYFASRARLVGTFHYQPHPIDKSAPYERRFKGFGCYKMWAYELADVTSFQALK